MLTEFRKRFIIETCNEHFRADGYFNCKTKLVEVPVENQPGYVLLKIDVVKGKKLKFKMYLLQETVISKRQKLGGC